MSYDEWSCEQESDAECLNLGDPLAGRREELRAQMLKHESEWLRRASVDWARAWKAARKQTLDADSAGGHTDELK